MFSSLYAPTFASRLTDLWNLGARGATLEALNVATALYQDAQRAGDREAIACSALQSAWFSFQMGRAEQGLEHATTARQIYQSLGSKVGEGAAVAMGAWLMIEAGLMEEAVLDAERALALVDPAGPPGIRGFVATALGVVLWYSGQASLAIPLCAEAVELADRARDPVAAAWWRINLAGAYGAVGGRMAGHEEGEAVQAALEEALRINASALVFAETVGDFWCQTLALCNAAEYLCTLGRIDEAMAHLTACDALPWVPMERSLAHMTTTRAEVLLRQRKYDETLVVCRNVLEHSDQAANLETRMLLFRHAAAAHEALGAFKAALDAFKQYHAAYLQLTVEKAQRHARIAGIRYETHRWREQAEAAEAQVASLVLTTQSDPLTGLANRRAVDQALADLTQTPRPYALAIIDLDHFKRINDRFSHQVGDAVLSQVGAILTACCPAGDFVARIGGEEFMLLVAGSDPGIAANLCETIRHAIATFPWLQHHPQLKVSTSIGIAQHGEADTPANVLALADQRLYEAKRLGRNCVSDGSGSHRPTRRATSMH